MATTTPSAPKEPSLQPPPPAGLAPGRAIGVAPEPTPGPAFDGGIALSSGPVAEPTPGPAFGGGIALSSGPVAEPTPGPAFDGGIALSSGPVAEPSPGPAFDGGSERSSGPTPEATPGPGLDGGLELSPGPGIDVGIELASRSAPGDTDDFSGMFDEVAGNPAQPPPDPMGDWQGHGGIDFQEPSLVSGAIPLDEASPVPAGKGASPAPAKKAREEIPRLEPAPRKKAAEQRSRLWPRGRKPQAEGPVSKALWSLLVVAALVYGVLVGLDRDPAHLFDRGFGDRDEAQGRIVAGDLASGVYATAGGGSLLYLTGTLDVRHALPPGSAIRVVGELLDPDDGVVARGEGWAGSLPTPEELWAVADEGSWRRLSRELSLRADPIAPGSGAAPFLVAFPNARTPGGPLRVRVTAAIEDAPAAKEGIAQDTGAE